MKKGSDRANVTIQGTDGNGEVKNAVVKHTTAARVREAEAAGAEIIINCNRDYKGRGFEAVEKLAHTTPRKKGGPHHIVYACYRATEEP